MFKNKKGRIYGIGDEAINMRESDYFSPTQTSDTVFILKFQRPWLYIEFT